MSKAAKTAIVLSAIALNVLTVMMMVFLNVPSFECRERRTYQKTDIEAKMDETEEFFTADEEEYVLVGIKLSSAEKILRTEPVFYVRFKTIHLLRRYGYNFYRVPNEAGLDIVVSGLSHELYCPEGQVEAVRELFNQN